MTKSSGLRFQMFGPEGAALFSEMHQACFAAEVSPNWDQAAFKTLLDMSGGVGLVGYRVCSDQDSDMPAGLVLYRLAAEEAEIITLGTLPADRRRGMASFLLDEMNSQCQMAGVKTIFLEVSSENSGAQALYRKHGFCEAGLRKDYFKTQDGQRIDAVLFRRSL